MRRISVGHRYKFQREIWRRMTAVTFVQGVPRVGEFEWLDCRAVTPGLWLERWEARSAAADRAAKMPSISLETIETTHALDYGFYA